MTVFTAGEDRVRIEATADAPVTGQLSADAHFSLLIGEGTLPINVTVTKYATSDNLTISHLLDDIEAAIAEATFDDGSDAHLDEKVTVSRSGNVITLTTKGTLLTVIPGSGDPARTELDFEIRNRFAVTSLIDSQDAV